MQATFPLETSLGLSGEAIASFLVFALTSSASAGPNDLLIMTIAGRSGLRSTLPSIAAITLAFGAMLVVGVIGGGIILLPMPILTRVLGTLGANWMLYLVWSIACQRPDAASEAALLHWSRALLLCWSNPKAWMLALTTDTAYLPQGPHWLRTLAFVISIKLVIGLASQLGWAVLGLSLYRLDAMSSHTALINRFMGGLLTISALTLLIG
ncbi:LysE family translocator [Asaia krungthepensis]|uniref:Threonine efflux protein n=1 Tax=Asaia krungthepensis NRIC 0535 TaxID=1307925 RepID=A0ABQ0PW16_9PROT|nr:hypothetical protein [Asaia krungthepensis]GBQ83011.1 putative threonine efflux protein [Asaia krungthepensis NRIC 0535]